MPLTVGGGLRTVDDVRVLLRAGADKVSLNTAALARPAVIREAAERFGSQCIVVAIDARRRIRAPPRTGRPRPCRARARATWYVYTHGGRRPTGRDAVAWAREAVALGAGEILLTSMDRDGTKDGYDLELTRADRRRRRPFPSSPPAAPARSSTSGRGSSRATPTRRWPRRSSTSAPTRSPRRSAICAERGVEVRLEP